MHSSGMCTARLLTISRSAGGVPRGCLPRKGGVYQGAMLREFLLRRCTQGGVSAKGVSVGEGMSAHRGCLPSGVSAWRRVCPRGVCPDTPLRKDTLQTRGRYPLSGQNDRRLWKHYFRKLRLRAVKIHMLKQPISAKCDTYFKITYRQTKFGSV